MQNRVNYNQSLTNDFPFGGEESIGKLNPACSRLFPHSQTFKPSLHMGDLRFAHGKHQQEKRLPSAYLLHTLTRNPSLTFSVGILEEIYVL